MTTLAENEALVTARLADGSELRGGLSRLSRSVVTFEVYGGNPVLQMSEVLSDFSVVLDQKTVYLGRAVVRNLVATNLMLTCEVSLGDHWIDAETLAGGAGIGESKRSFQGFLKSWQGAYRVGTEFKEVVADLHGFLSAMRLWTEQIELEQRRKHPGLDTETLRETAARLCKETTPALESLFDRLESCSERIDPELHPAHRSFVRHQLHPLLMCSPFLHRVFHKPLGYAGDYEMVNMLIRNPFEGASLFAFLVNHWFLQQAPAEAHRNRIKHLIRQLQNVTAMAAREGRTARILNLGCGPAGEVQQFIRENHYSDHARFMLLDFNEETITDTGNQLRDLIQRHQRRTIVQLEKRSVNQIIKEFGKPRKSDFTAGYDLVYCAGLYDYLSDAVSRRVSTVLHDWTAPGGMFLATNVDVSNPRTMIMDFVMDWHLIYRNARQMLAVRPMGIPEGEAVVKSDVTGVNIFLEVTKPNRE